MNMAPRHMLVYRNNLYDLRGQKCKNLGDRETLENGMGQNALITLKLYVLVCISKNYIHKKIAMIGHIIRGDTHGFTNFEFNVKHFKSPYGGRFL